MLQLKKIFKPSGRKFYTLLDQVGSNLIIMSQRLAELVEETDISNKERLIDNIRNLESENDEISHSIYTELGRNFITPFDREDIHDLAHALDEIADYILAMAILFRTYHLTESGKATIDVAKGLQHIVSLLALLLQSIKHQSKLNNLYNDCVAIHKAIQELDHKIDMAVAEMLHNDADPLVVVKMMDHYDSAQMLIDKCGDAVNVVETIIVKYG